MPPNAALSLLGLPPDLLIRVLACLSTRDRAGLPLVCKALNQLLDDPGSCSLLWGAMDLSVVGELKDAALQSRARKLLQRRGQRTRTLVIHLKPELPELWRQIFSAALPPFFPELRELEYAGAAFPWRLRDLKLLTDFCCSRLQGLTLELHCEPLVEAFACICKLRLLTSLNVKGGSSPTSAASLQAAMAPLQDLSNLRVLSLRPKKSACDYEMPACFPSRLQSLESLCLDTFVVHLPVNFGTLQHLSTLRLVAHGTNIWPAISGLKVLKDLILVCIDAVPDMQQPGQTAAFSHCLTSLLYVGELRSLLYVGEFGDPSQPATVPERLLALPALEALDYSAGVAFCFNGASLTSLRALTVAYWADESPPQALSDALGQSCLTRLVIHEGEGVSDAVAAKLCQLQALRSLELCDTAMTTLPVHCVSTRLTELCLIENPSLELDAAAYHGLISLPVLQSLEICVCRVRSPAPAVAPHSLAYLQLIGKGLGACVACDCHAEGWAPSPTELVF